MGSQTSAMGTQVLDAPLNRIEVALAALVGKCEPVSGVNVERSQSPGCICAQDIFAPHALPLCDEALLDGRAVNSADLIGASPMSPAFAMAEPARVRVGDPIPPSCDAIIDSALVVGGQAPFEIHGSPAPGEGVRRAGDDFSRGDLIIRARARISAVDAFTLAMAGVDTLTLRQPRVRIIATSDDANMRASAHLVADLAIREGAMVDHRRVSVAPGESIAEGLDGDWAAAFVIGGTGRSEGDCTIEALRSSGQALAYGLALDPGRTGAAGFVNGKPFICLPGRFEAALGVYIALGRPLLRHLAGALPAPRARQAPLARKISSSVGVAQLAFFEFSDGKWSPLTVGDLTLAGLTRSSAYLIIPEASEGMAEGALVQPLIMPGRSDQQ